VKQATENWDPFYTLTTADWGGLGFGALSGIGYAATIWLPDCADAGFEMGASAFIIYELFGTNSGYTLLEQIFLPIPDYIQMGSSIFYMYACVSKNYTSEATWLVFMVKYLQAAVLPYVYVMSYLQGPRHNMFLASFAFVKQFFNFLDSTVYINQEYNILGFLESLL
jgi:hypothetical protein